MGEKNSFFVSISTDEIMKYVEPKKISRKEADLALKSPDSGVVSHALVNIAFFESEWKWSQDVCLQFVDDRRIEVAQVALTCIGHIARIHGQLDKKVIQKLNSLRKNSKLGGYAENALSDYEIFRSIKDQGE